MLLGQRIFKGVLTNLDDTTIRAIVETLNDHLDSMSVVLTGRGLINNKGKAIYVDCMSSNAYDKIPTRHTHTMVAFDITSMEGNPKSDDVPLTQGIFCAEDTIRQYKQSKKIKELEDQIKKMKLEKESKDDK